MPLLHDTQRLLEDSQATYTGNPFIEHRIGITKLSKGNGLSVYMWICVWWNRWVLQIKHPRQDLNAEMTCTCMFVPALRNAQFTRTLARISWLGRIDVSLWKSEKDCNFIVLLHSTSNLIPGMISCSNVINAIFQN